MVGLDLPVTVDRVRYRGFSYNSGYYRLVSLLERFLGFFEQLGPTADESGQALGAQTAIGLGQECAEGDTRTEVQRPGLGRETWL